MRGRFKILVMGMMMGGAAWAQPMVPPGFAFLDKNYDGYLSPEELSRASGHLTPEVARFLDFNGDGAISPDEWRQGRQQVRSDMVKGAVRLGTQHLFGIQPPPTYLLGRYLELRQRYEDTHRAASDPALQQGYDQPEERYTTDAYDDQRQQPAHRAAQERYDDSQERYDDRPHSAGSAAQGRDDTAQEGDELPYDRQVNRHQPTQGHHDENQERYGDQRQQPAHRAAQERYDDSQERYDDRPHSAGSPAQERDDTAQEGDNEQSDDRPIKRRPTLQGAVQERLGDLRERHENQRRVVHRTAQERLDEVRKGSDGQNSDQRDRARLRQHRPFQAQGRAEGRRHAVLPFGQERTKPGRGGLLRHPGLGHNAGQ